MTDTIAAHHELADVYLKIRDLTGECFPAYVARDDESTLVYIDPTASRVEVAIWMLGNLTEAEGSAFRSAYGLHGRRATDAAEPDGIVGFYVPKQLRLPTLAERVAATAERSAELLAQSRRIYEIVAHRLPPRR